MLKTLLGGVAVGIANIIPGVSGGTMLVILGLFDKLMESISDVFSLKSTNRWKSMFFILQILIGAGIGLVGFAKIIDWLFEGYSTQTFYWFIGLVLFSIPALLKSELKGNKISWPLMLLGGAIIFVIVWFSPEKKELIITQFPELNAGYLISLIFVGMISGATMLFPGISGSLVLLIIGQYYIFKSYAANVTTFKMEVLIPLMFIAAGIALGILLSAKLTAFLLRKSRGETVSFILGMIIASVVVLIPIHVDYTFMTIISSVISFGVGAVVVLFIDRLVK